MSAFLCPTFGVGYQSFTNQGVVNAGGHIKTYLAGSTTPQATWTDSTQGTSNGSDITLDSAGRPSTEIWLQSGVAYKIIVTDPNGVQIGATFDYVSGINDTNSAGTSQWVATGLTPTYVSTTQFTVPGDQTAIFQAERRIQYTLGSGTFYGSITASAFTTVTTVTVLADTTALDNTVSAVNVGLLTPTNRSEPIREGSLSLTLTTSGGSGSVTGSATGTYMRVGNRVFLDIALNVTDWGSRTGQVTVTGLPITAAQAGYVNGFITTSSTDPNVYGKINSAGTTILLYKLTGLAFNASDSTVAWGMALTGWYRVA